MTTAATKQQSTKNKYFPSNTKRWWNDNKVLAIVLIFCTAFNVASVQKLSVFTSFYSFRSIDSNPPYEQTKSSNQTIPSISDSFNNTPHGNNDTTSTTVHREQDNEINSIKDAEKQQMDHQENINNEKNSCTDILPNTVMLKNKVLSQDSSRNIPRIIHFVVRSRCVPEEVATVHNAGWESVSKDHSILYHDQQSIDEYMAQDRRDWPAVASVYKCAFDSMAKSDLAKLMLLWDHGGIVVDMGHVPRPEFEEGNIISDTDQCVFEMTREGRTNPRFAACQAGHSAVYAAIMRFLTVPFVDYTHKFPYSWEKRSGIFGFAASFMVENQEIDGKKSVLKYKTGQLNGTITQIHTNGTFGELLETINFQNDTLRDMELELITASEQEHCMNRAALKNDSYEVDIASLLDVVGYKTQNSICTSPQNFIGSNYNEGSIIKGRKIPKFVHMTSKSQCFTDFYTWSINKWKFDGYSLFMHDDIAVDRLLSREWPEFPLLKEATSCIATGAGLADLWRYLVIWEYGGIYTDIDNEPGPKFLNASLITDDMDSLFEQEGGGFPSQYFFAASPHHPVMYHAVHHTISRLMEVQSISEQMVPFVTGPGALKCGVISTIGNGYPSKGIYKDPSTNRTITVVGSRREAGAYAYLKRSVVENKKIDLVKMGMRHYSKEGDLMKRNKIKMHSCLSEIYHKSFMSSTNGKL